MTTVILCGDDQGDLSRLVSTQRTVRKLILDRVERLHDDDDGADAAVALGELIAKSTKLETLCLLRTRISEKSLRTLFEVGINRCASLECLCICATPSSDNAPLAQTLLSCLSQLLQQRTCSLQTLRLSHCNFRDRDVVRFARKGLRHNTSLHRLVISRNPRLRDRGACAIFEAVQQHHPTLVTLDLSHNKIAMEADQLAKALSCPLSGSTTRRRAQLSLSLYGNERIGRGNGIVLLSKVLAADPPIESLCLSKCGIDKRGMGCVGEALKFNTTLRCLDLKRNGDGLDAASIQHFVDETIRPHNMTLEKVLLDGALESNALGVLLEWNRLGRRCLLQASSSSSCVVQLQRMSEEASTDPLTLLYMALRQKPDLMSPPVISIEGE